MGRSKTNPAAASLLRGLPTQLPQLITNLLAARTRFVPASLVLRTHSWTQWSDISSFFLFRANATSFWNFPNFEFRIFLGLFSFIHQKVFVHEVQFLVHVKTGHGYPERRVGSPSLLQQVCQWVNKACSVKLLIFSWVTTPLLLGRLLLSFQVYFLRRLTDVFLCTVDIKAFMALFKSLNRGRYKTFQT